MKMFHLLGVLFYLGIGMLLVTLVSFCFWGFNWPSWTMLWDGGTKFSYDRTIIRGRGTMLLELGTIFPIPKSYFSK